MLTASVHTSDRILYKRCRRRWNWQSPLRQHLQSKQKRLPLWFGTGWHFVMEDYHGARLYSDSHECWEDYNKATLGYYGLDFMPEDWEEGRRLGHEMLKYYKVWLIGRDPLTTFVFDGVPQTEVNFTIEIPIDQGFLEGSGFNRCVYEGTIDRVTIDDYGNLWIDEYKTAKAIQKAHFLTDPQVTSYAWAAQKLYGRPVAGCTYTQWKKSVPDEPTVLKSGHISVNQQQAVTHRLYREALIKLYGEVTKAPKANVDFLNLLAGQETAENDGFISRERIYRNEQSLAAEGVKILMECEEMLNLNLPLYPNPTRDCQYMCDFRDACISLDDGSDWEEIIEADFETRNEERGRDPWRQLLRHQPPRKALELLLPQSDPGINPWPLQPQNPQESLSPEQYLQHLNRPHQP